MNATDARLSEWALRQAAGHAGYATTHEQFVSYCHWGLLPAPDRDHRWPSDCAQRLVEIREAGSRARQLPRRVVLLRGDYLRFPVPPGLLREAMAELAPSITAPVRKLRRMHDAAVRYGAWQSGTSTAESPHVVLPAPAEWAALLRTRALTEDVFGSRAGAAYFLVRILESQGPRLGIDLLGIPFEDQVVALLVRDLALAGRGGWWRDSK